MGNYNPSPNSQKEETQMEYPDLEELCGLELLEDIVTNLQNK